jgi:dihydroneopterin aldolase
MKGKCTVKGMNFHAFHGAMEVERELGQVFSVDVTLYLDLIAADASPQVKAEVRGSDVYEVAKNIMMGTKFNAHTSLALAIAKEMFNHFKHVTDVEVAIGRKQLYIAGDVKKIIAEVYCSREDFDKKG